MEKIKQKTKKEKPNKYVEKEKSPSFMSDVKTLKENLKIKEILRTVKMNSSMRIKAPRGSKVMQNKDFSENEDIFDDTASFEGLDLSEPPSATNALVVNNSEVTEGPEDDSVNDEEADSSETDLVESDKNVETETNSTETCILHKSKSLSEGLEDSGRDRVSEPDAPKSPTILPPLENPHMRARDRKLSLDHTMLSKREGLSQSEADLYSIGKSPLERKSSFFRKKMDSFLKNTTEIFKRQSLGGKSPQPVQRRGSTSSRMSVSMQSLNENEAYNGGYDSGTLDKYEEEFRGSATSLRSSMTLARSNSSLSVNQSDRMPPEEVENSSPAGSRHSLVGSQPLPDRSSNSINSLSEAYNQESFLHSRAISMSSGLDTAHGPRRKKSSRSNRVTWVASERVTDYFRRLIQDEKTNEIQGSHSYQDFSTIPENNLYGSPKTDSKGRRLSYQRAVSGEDPVLPTRYQDSSFRRRKAQPSDGSHDISKILAEFTRSGVPPIKSFQIRPIPEDALTFLHWAEIQNNLEGHYDWKKLLPNDEARQAVIKELIHTEADHIRHLKNIVEIYIAAAHALQDLDLLLTLVTKRLFLNIPDVLNANMMFWELVLYPMIKDSVHNKTIFNTDLMADGFSKFGEIFKPYEDYVHDQAQAVKYLRTLTSNPEFMTYLTWCHSQNTQNRLQLNDILVKPMQRLTKYSLLIRRLIMYTESEEQRVLLEIMEDHTVKFVQRADRVVRQKEEIEQLEEIERYIEPYEVDFKDEEMDKYFHMFSEMDLKEPMINCGPNNSRALIFRGDLRFRDNLKETDARFILFTDILLVCKKITKGGHDTFKMIRPKYFVQRLVQFPRTGFRTNEEITGFAYVILDELGASCGSFCVADPSKDALPNILKTWEQKFNEARVSYDLSVWFFFNPVKDLSEIEAEIMTEAEKKARHEEWTIEHNSRLRVAAMMYSNKMAACYPDTSNIRCDFLDFSRGPPSLRNPLRRISIRSSRSSRISSLQQSSSSRSSRMSSFYQSTSVASHDEPVDSMKYIYKTGASVEHLIPPLNPDDVARSITVNVVSESESETAVPSRQPSPPMLVLQKSSPSHSPSSGLRSSSAGGSQNQDTLKVSPQHIPMVHSLPDLTVEQMIPKAPPIIQQSASEKLYQSHNELLERNRLAASQHQYLSPDHRGISYPPPSPTRGSLKRGMAFSHSLKHPPLSKMSHVLSQSQVHIDLVQPSTSKKVPAAKDAAGKTSEKGDKKKHLVRNKTGAKSSSDPVPPKDIETEQVAGPSKSEDDKKTVIKKNKSDRSEHSAKSP